MDTVTNQPKTGSLEFDILDSQNTPKVRIKSIRFQNYKVFEDFKFDFSNKDEIKQFLCFIGPNGVGKSTILSATRLIFGNFENLDEDRLYYNLGRSIRHSGKYKDNSLSTDNFLITAEIQSSFGDYEIQIDRNGFVKDHPQEIKDYLYKIYFYTRFDQELHNFQLKRSQWKRFKAIFEAITGFKIKEHYDVFSTTDDPEQSKLINDYVLAFTVKKPHETILHKECSDGERKIIKSFSTLLNLEFQPQIIMTDNVEMHVQSSRHLNLIKEMKLCFPDSQIFTTTHSYHISRHFAERNQIYDLRIIYAKPVVVEEQWRLFIADEIQDRLVKLEGLLSRKKFIADYDFIKKYGEKLYNISMNKKINNIEIFKDNVKGFVSDVDNLYVDDLISGR